MIFLPIVERELRVASRRGVTYHTRFWTVFAAILICGWKLMSFAQGAVPPSQSGQNLFNTLSLLAFVYCLFCGAQVTADCLSEEKREGTLGLLFLTDLKGYDVILGKLAASSINSIYGVVSILPLLALPLLLGGVPASSFWRMTLVLINTMFLSLAVGMLVSTLSRHERKAMMATSLVMFTLIISPYVILFMMALADWNFNSPESVLPFIVLSPLYGFLSAMDLSKSAFVPAGIFTDEGFWLSLLIVHLCAWLFLLGASSILPRAWKEKATQPDAGPVARMDSAVGLRRSRGTEGLSHAAAGNQPLPLAGGKRSHETSLRLGFFGRHDRGLAMGLLSPRQYHARYPAADGDVVPLAHRVQNLDHL
jgi:ABC-type transport system involved in multi-copper enzyme maturation permease subunit